jgi:hypothetical protein
VAGISTGLDLTGPRAVVTTASTGIAAAIVDDYLP